jgi:hypothetical protein
VVGDLAGFVFLGTLILAWGLDDWSHRTYALTSGGMLLAWGLINILRSCAAALRTRRHHRR